MARSFIEAGAGIIFCHHAHRLQGYEKYQNGYIFYGLGNTIFADLVAVSWNVKWTTKERKSGIAICKFNIKNSELKGEIIPIIQKGLMVYIDKDKRRIKELRKLCKTLSLNNNYYRYYWNISRYLDVIDTFLFYKGENPIAQILKIRSKHILTTLMYLNLKNNKKTS